VIRFVQRNATGMWKWSCLAQSVVADPAPDKRLSSIRLAEALGVSQPTAWCIGHARLTLACENPLGGMVEIGGRPKKKPDEPPPGRGRKGLRRTTKRKTKTLWSRVPPALQLPQIFRAAVGRELRRTRIGGIAIKSPIAVFG
jgi:hypothetical protein